MNVFRLGIGVGFVVTASACASSPTLRDANEDTTALKLTGVVDRAAFALDSAVAVAIGGDDHVYSTHVRDDGSFQLDLPVGHAYEIVVANETTDGELRVVGHLVNPTSRGLRYFLRVKQSGRLSLGQLGKVTSGTREDSSWNDADETDSKFTSVERKRDRDRLCKERDADEDMWPGLVPGDAWSDDEGKGERRHFEKTPKRCRAWTQGEHWTDDSIRPFEIDFTAPETKIEETSSLGFTEKLYRQALTIEPLLGAKGTQVSMGYWSGPGNHGSLVRVLDAINSSPDVPPHRAIWDEGATTSFQYPAYVTMLHESWYERSAAIDGHVLLHGVEYDDPHPVTFEQADQIWGQYSQRYADMAVFFKAATGNAVQAWCFVEGARANRIFYTFELPELEKLEAKGYVTVHFAKTQNADYTNPNDWIDGTTNAPAPLVE